MVQTVSEEGGFGISFIERFFGLLLIIIGVLASYYTFTSIEALRAFTGFFGLLSILIFTLGLVLITAKTE
jgi:hypothetical protein